MSIAAIEHRVRRGSLGRALVLSSGGTAAARLAGAVGGLLAARLLGPTGRGQFAILVFLAAALSMAGAAGVQFWVAREVARTRGVRSAAWVLRCHVVVLLVATGLVGLLAGGIVGDLAEVGPVVVWAAIALAATNAVQLVVLALPNGMRAMGVVAAAMVVAGLVYVIAAAALLVVDERSISLVLLGAVIGNVVSILIACAWVARAPKGDAPMLTGRTHYARALRFGLPAGAGELVLLAMLRADVLIVALFLPLRDVGLYAVATAVAEVLWVLPDGVAQVVLPTTAGDPTASRTPRLLRATVMWMAGAGALLALVSLPLVETAFGSEFRGAASAVPLLVVASIAGGVWKVVGSEIVALGRTTPRLTSALWGFAVMVAVDVVAVPALGIVGAALGSACAYAVAALVVTRSWSTDSGLPIRMLMGFTRKRVLV